MACFSGSEKVCADKSPAVSCGNRVAAKSEKVLSLWRMLKKVGGLQGYRVAGWRLEVGGWRLEVRGWRLEVDHFELKNSSSH